MEKPCGILLPSIASSENLNHQEIKKILEKGDDKQKIDALKRSISLILSGEKIPGLLMIIIRFVLTTKNHTLKKLLLIYWEVIDMVGPDGELLPEMILVCNALRNDLIHPNEFVRGATLRFICKVKVAELLEPLVPSIIKNLEHRYSYVKQNAVLALKSVYLKTPQLCPDAPEIVYDYLKNEDDNSCKRNGLLMLFSCNHDLAIRFLNESLGGLSSWGEILQCIAIDIIRKHTREGISDSQKTRYLRAILPLLKGQPPSVQYEAACAILELSSAPISAKAAASAFIELLCSQSDNNIKLITLDKLELIKKKQNKVLQELLMDTLRALACPTLDIRKRTLNFALDLVNPTNIDSVIMLLQKEINKTQTGEVNNGSEYRKLLVKAIHGCALKFPDIAGKVVHALMDHLGDDDSASAVSVVSFVSEVIETYAEHRESILRKLLDSLSSIKSVAVLRVSLWIIGEYCESIEDLDISFTQVKKQLGPMPLYTPPNDEEQTTSTVENTNETKKVPKTTNTKVLADGTYATQSAYVPDNNEPTSIKKSTSSFLRDNIVNGNFVLASVVIRSFVKIALKLKESQVADTIKNGVSAEVLYFAASILQFLDMKEYHKEPIAVDVSKEEIISLIKILLDPNPILIETMLQESRIAHKNHLVEFNSYMSTEPSKKTVDVQPDDLLSIRLLQGSKYGHISYSDDSDMDLMKATGASESNSEIGSLNRVYQLTGFSDPLYAECYINTHKYDIVLEVLVINRTKDTLQNVGLELSTMGDLKLEKRAHLQTHTIAPLGKVWIKTDIKVSSTEAGMIYGNLVYDIAGSATADKHCVVLNNIKIDIIDYIEPATCSDSQYRSMWYEFEWENKVPVNAKFDSVFEFLENIKKATNMKCLTPESSMQGDCRFLAANLYARSIFGEDALANMSIEQLETGEISGYIRIRSKTQGIALSLGDKIAQRCNN